MLSSLTSACTTDVSNGLIVKAIPMHACATWQRHPPAVSSHAWFCRYYQTKASTALESEKLIRSQEAARGVVSASLISSTWAKVRGLGFWVAFNFFITLSVFPAVTADVQTYSFATQKAKWVGLYCFLLFNSGDWCGRLLAGWARIKNGWGLRLLILCRVGFLPLFMLCNHCADPKCTNHPNAQLPIIFKHDGYPVAFMLLFAISNGYAGTICMMTAPSLVSDAAGMQAGTIMASCLVLGIVLGATQ